MLEITQGETRELAPPVIAIDDPAVQLGAGGVFETLRAENQRIQLFTAHMGRLRRSLRFWKIELPCTEMALLEAAETEIGRLGGEPARLRITVGPDPGTIGKGDSARESQSGRVWIEATALADHYRGPLWARSPMRVCVFRDYHLSSQDPRAGHKMVDYYLWSEARRRAENRGFDEAILLNERGELAEACAFNLFWIEGDIVKTPDPACGGLPGIFAAHVVQILDREGIAVRNVRSTPSALKGAECLFLTNSLGEIIGIRAVDGKATTPPANHPLGRQILELIEAARLERFDASIESA